MKLLFYNYIGAAQKAALFFAGMVFTQYTKTSTMQKTFGTITAMLFSMIALAQDKAADIDVDIDKDGGGIMSSPILWIVGGALFILLLVALTRGGGRSSSRTTTDSGDRVTVTKTVERDSTTDL